eukprot:TRINITY_DN17966_c0_g1_i1.p1 TRINITY_DN17966_c0_g1~~TRINITY_DN17966_c0_g1_i1.p1  ORF type:complete len:362 (-),score=79.42 TRINITY_DN17966_c0_g1_i1:79-1059(-)
MAKLFIGNLSFKTREQDLQQAFEPYGKVVAATIIYRGPRSLGFGFVEYETAEMAQAAVTAMNQKEVDGMKINVEVARPQRPRMPRAAPVAGFPAPAPVAGAAAPVAGATPMDPAAAAAQQMRAPRNNMRRGPARYGNPAQAPRGFYNMMIPPPGYPMAYPQQQMGGQQQMMPPYGGQMMQMPPRAPRMPRAPRQERPLSDATLFVANLPFVVNDENLKEIFADLSVKDAHVVMSPTGRSRGYGFVEFASKDARDKALQTLDKIEVENRVLVIKPAMAPPARRTNAPVAPVAAAAAAAPAVVAATPEVAAAKVAEKPAEKAVEPAKN